MLIPINGNFSFCSGYQGIDFYTVTYFSPFFQAITTITIVIVTNSLILAAYLSRNKHYITEVFSK